MMRSEELKKKSELLCSIPGVGPLTALLFLLEVGDINRFTSFDELNSFVGLCPGSYSSGQRERQTGMTRRSHNGLRSALIESAWMLIRADVAMLNKYKELQKRMKASKAIVVIARKLLRRMRAVLVHEKVYVKGIEGAVSAQQIDAPSLLAPNVKGRTKNAVVASTGAQS